MTQRDRILLAVVLLVGIVGGGWFGVAKPKRHDAQQLDQQIAAARTDLAGASARAAQYRAARTSLLKHPEAFKQSARALPNRAATPELLRTLTRKAKGTGIKMTDFKASPGSETTPGITSVGLELGFTGDFLALQRYLSRLQSMVGVTTQDVNAKGRLLALKSVSLAPAENQALTAKVSATVYILQAGSLAAAATAAPTASPTTAGGA